MPPAVSVVIPLYNKEATILRALDSVFRQTVQDFEIIVVNDGSTDGSRQALSAITDPRLRIIDQPNAGAAAARNRGIAEAASDLIAFLDADDEWLPHFLDTVLDLRRRYPSAGVYSTAYRIQPPDARGYVVRLRRLPFQGPDGILSNYFEVASQSDPPLNSSSTVVTLIALNSVGGFPEAVVSGEDLLTWARLAACYPIAYSRRVSSVFYCPSRLNFQRSNCGAEAVELGLEDLLVRSEEGKVTGLTAYLGRWHEMRAVVAIGQGDFARARRHLMRLMRLRGLGPRSVTLWLLAILPVPIGSAAFRTLRKWRHSHLRTMGPLDPERA
jgi:hypothetical protein